MLKYLRLSERPRRRQCEKGDDPADTAARLLIAMAAARSLFLPLVALVLMAGARSGRPASPQERAALVYPPARTVNQVDDFHGTKVADPYRWLEEENSPETRAWIEAENKITFGYLSEIPERARIKERLTQLWNY